jgi:hypothetical protein
MKITKPLKAIGERSGRLKKMLGAEISKEISETHNVKFDEQMAIAMNALEAIFAYIEAESGKDIRPEDFKKYEILRADVKEAIYGRVKSI